MQALQTDVNNNHKFGPVNDPSSAESQFVIRGTKRQLKHKLKMQVQSEQQLRLIQELWRLYFDEKVPI